MPAGAIHPCRVTDFLAVVVVRARYCNSLPPFETERQHCLRYGLRFTTHRALVAGGTVRRKTLQKICAALSLELDIDALPPSYEYVPEGEDE
jgi:hypothetical protein